MGINNYNWSNKDQNAIHAEKWVCYCKENFPAFIKSSIEKSKIYGTEDIPKTIDDKKSLSTEFVYLNTDTVSAIYEAWNKNSHLCKIAALNFASYKNPGGGYLLGATAQEECLCSESNLYNIISAFYDSFYKPHLKKLNGGLYGDDLLYSPNVLFFKNGYQKTMVEDFDGDIREYASADVITCAAPNYYPIQKYGKYPYEKVVQAMISRIDHILYAAYKEGVDSIILGAFGCGVFMNDPVIVSQIFHFFIKTKYNGCFLEAIFAVPTIRNDDTFKVFKESGEIMLDYLENDGKITNGNTPELVKYFI